MNRNYNYYQNIKEILQRQLADLESTLDWLNSQDAVDELYDINREDNVVSPPQEMLEIINSIIDDTHRQIEDVNAKLMTIHAIHNTWADGRTHIPDRPLRRRPTRRVRRIPQPPPPVTQPDLVIDISDDDNSPPPILFLPSTPTGSPPSTPPSSPPSTPPSSPPSTPPSSPPHYLPSSPINSPPRRGGLGAGVATKRNKRIVHPRKSKQMQHSRKRTKRSRKNKIR